jgi:multiple sugar transport system substrate-binding protein
VAFADDFLQPTKLPLNAAVFNEAAGRMAIPPLLDTWDELESAVAPYLEELLFSVPILDLVSITDQIDAASVPILDPEATPTATPSGTTTPSP